MEYKYDFHGCRCTQTGSFDIKQIQNRVLEKKRSFSYGRRTDLSRPLNFNPGPGYYNPATESVGSLGKKQIALNP